MAPDDLLKHQLASLLYEHPDNIEFEDDNDCEALRQARQKLVANPDTPLEDLIE